MYQIIERLCVLGQQTESDVGLLTRHLLAAVVFSVVGVVVFFASLWLMEKLTKFSIVREIGEEHNIAMAIIIGAIVLGIAMIISAAVLG